MKVSNGRVAIAVPAIITSSTLQSRRSPVSDLFAEAAALLPAVEPLLESQLGLKLRRAEGPVDVLVIENVERPTDN